MFAEFAVAVVINVVNAVIMYFEAIPAQYVNVQGLGFGYKALSPKTLNPEP